MPRTTRKLAAAAAAAAVILAGGCGSDGTTTASATSGTILARALIVAPAAAARLWSGRLPVIAALAMTFGVFSGVIGLYASSPDRAPAAVVAAGRGRFGGMAARGVTRC